MGRGVFSLFCFVFALGAVWHQPLWALKKQSTNCKRGLEEATEQVKQMPFAVTIKPRLIREFRKAHPQWAMKVAKTKGVQLVRRLSKTSFLYVFTEEGMQTVIAAYAPFVDFKYAPQE